MSNATKRSNKIKTKKVPIWFRSKDVAGDPGKNTFSQEIGTESRRSKLRNIIALILTKIVGVNKLILHVETLCLNMEWSKDRDRSLSSPQR